VTDTNARTTANVLPPSAGVAAAYVILTRPPLPRLASTATMFSNRDAGSSMIAESRRYIFRAFWVARAALRVHGAMENAR